MPKWTSEQKLAIDKEGTNVIVSAGAGSGKTAVLTERVLRKLRSGVSISNLLILTFTKAAAAEMKTRIRDKIKEDPELKSELNKVDGAYITTFDSYALSIVKKYHYLLNVSKNVSIGESSIFTLKTSEILDDIFNELYEQKDPLFEKLIGDFCVKDDNEIRSSILKMNSKLDLRYDKNNYLKNYINNFYSDESINKFINDFWNIVDKKREILESNLEELGGTLEESDYEKQYNYYNGMAYAKDYNTLVRYIPTERSPLLPKGNDDAKKIKEVISSITKELISLCKYSSIDDIKTSLIKTKDYAQIIIKIILELDERLNLFKYENDTYDFIDISKMAIKVLELFPYIRQELKNNFSEIMVDEYQDTNDLQEMFISMISNNNVYMVGDIKQSIYRFRNANPYIFKNKYDMYSKNNGGFKIDLNKNFRSRSEVLSNINIIFDDIMDDIVGGANYKESHEMIFGNTSYDSIGKSNQNNDMEFYNYNFDKELGYKKEEIEAFIIAKDILDKINNKYLVFNPKEDNPTPKPCKFSDFVIMIDRSTNFNLYKKIFTYMHIPLSVKKDESIKNNTDLNLLKNIIVLITKINLKEFDIEFKNAFTSIARSYLFRLSDNEIFDIIRLNTYNKTDIYSLCDSIAKCVNDLSNRRLLDMIIDKFNYYEKLITVGNIDEAINRLDYLKGIADSLNALGYTVIDFKNYLINLVKSDDLDLKYSVIDDAPDAVKIMTIHASKGLEFQICYFSGLYASFNLGDIKERFLYDPYIGIITPYFNEGIDDTILKIILKEHYVLEEISEKDRLFYVALTRAREKMIMLLPREENETIPALNMDTKLKYRSFKDMLLSINNTICNYSKDIDVNKLPLSHDYNISKTEYFDNLTIDDDILEYEPIVFSKETIDDEHFSKTNHELITKESFDNMEYGTHIHEVFESIDILNPNLKKLSKFEQEKVTLFLNSDILIPRPNKFYQEYEFKTIQDNKIMHGIIDLLLEYDDHYTIIDYKLKGTTDDAYVNQINGYKKYIRNKTGKEVNSYLYSITLNEFKEIR